MREKLKEYMKTVVDAYLLLLLVILPVYMRNGLVMIGDEKYYFFRNGTLVFMVLVIIGGILWWKDSRFKIQWKLSMTDMAVMLFGVASVVSFLGSADKYTAFLGYADWHMGLLSQMMFVWIYFVASRWYSGEENVWKIAGAAACVVFLLGVLNRMEIDPLGIYNGMDLWDWNRNNLLSTIGNSNWYCGYASVASAIVLYYCYKGEGWIRIVGMLGMLITFATLVTQGSESAYPMIAAMLLVLLMCSLGSRRNYMNFIRTVCLLPIACIFFQFLLKFTNVPLRLNTDGSMSAVLFFQGWWVILLLLMILYVVEGYREKEGMPDCFATGKIRKVTCIVLLGLAVLVIVIIITCQLSEEIWIALGSIKYLRLNNEWGNERGMLWYMSVRTWLNGDIKQFFIGVGPDCFANVIYNTFSVTDMLGVSGQWENAIFANAHNEWLNMLVNEGILGALAYLGIFVTAFYGLWKRKDDKLIMIVLLAIAGYMANATFSFQQVVSTPLMFAVLGMGEQLIRSKKKEGK